MRSRRLVLAVALLLIPSMEVSAGVRIAVLSEKGATVRSNAMLAAGEDRITEALTARLTAQPGITVIAQGEMDRILAAQNFQNSDRASSDTASRIGKAANAEYVVFVNLANAIQTAHQETAFGSITTKGDVQAEVSAKVINIESGIDKATATSTFKDSAVATVLKFGAAKGQGLPAAYNDLWTKCTNSIADDLASKLKDSFVATSTTATAPSATAGGVKVIGVDSGKVFLDSGLNAGIKVGDRFQITRSVPTHLKDKTGATVMDVKQVCAMSVETVAKSNASGKCVGDTPQADDDAEPMKEQSESGTGNLVTGDALNEALPAQLLECDGKGPCNAAWSFHGTEGDGIWFAQTAVRAKLTVLSAKPGDIRIRRTDLTGGRTGLYSGTRSGNRVSGTVVWSTPGHPGESSETWSASPPQTACPASMNLPAADALRIGQNALMFNLQLNALDCYKVAAREGDPRAQTVVGLIYYRGEEGMVAQDYKAALPWLRQAADQGVYPAQKTVADMYTLGQGIPADEKLAKFYSEKAAEQKRDWERQQDRQDRAANNMLTGFVVGTVLGATLF